MWFDEAGSATWQQARKQTFTHVDHNINLGYKTGVLWVRVQVQVEKAGVEHVPPEWWLEVAPAFLDEVTLWVEPPSKPGAAKPVAEPLAQRAGAAVHPDLRPLWHRNSVFLVKMPNAGTYTLWLRVHADNVKAVTPFLWQINALEKNTQIKTIVAGLFYGVFICLILIAIILGLTIGTPIFLMCAGYLFLLGLNIFIADGWLGLLIFMGHTHTADKLSSSCLALLIPMFVSVFSQVLLAEKYAPRLMRWYLIFARLIALAAVVLLWAGYFVQVAPVVNMLAMLQMVFIVVLALWIIPQEPTLRWVQLALIPVILPGALRWAQNVGIDFSINTLTTWMLAGSSLHGMILLFFVARIVAQSYQSNLKAQVQIIAGAAQLEEQRDFVALLSHEFRNPLFTLSSALTNMHRQSLDADSSARRNRMDRALARLKYVLGYCLADERLATLQPAQRQRRPLSVNDIIEESLQQLDDQSQRLQLHTGDPASQVQLDSVLVLGELPLLGAALKNLLDNALKYAGNGPVQLSVGVAGSLVTFKVRDHGPGLDEVARSRLFKKFSRGQQHLHTAGAGLGLHLSRKIVHLHGGDIRISNASGGGALAELTLPLMAS
jgi:signal transduction histidine kinase